MKDDRKMSDLDRAVIAWREDSTEANRNRLMQEQDKHMREFFRREAKELGIEEKEQPRFVIEIALGNEAMQTGRDVADALARIQHRIEDLLQPLAKHNSGYHEPVRDGNGNTVGRWGVT